jgi:hypothetical protein
LRTERHQSAQLGAESPEIIPKHVRHAFCIFERDDGLFEIGLSDARGPFESRRFAEAVANRDTGDPPDKRRRPRRANPRALINRLVNAAATLTYAKPESLSTESYRVVAPNGLLIGSYPSRLEAAQASGVCQ